jgi:uncharacterized protein (TIGR00369 family)
MDINQSLKSWLNHEMIPPIATHLGITLLSAADGRAIAELVVRPTLFNAMGTLHGGVFADLADATMGAAIASAAEPGESFTTTHLSVHYFTAIRQGVLRADATLIRRGRSSGFVECSLLDTSSNLVAKATSSCTFFWPGTAI